MTQQPPPFPGRPPQGPQHWQQPGQPSQGPSQHWRQPGQPPPYTGQPAPVYAAPPAKGTKPAKPWFKKWWVWVLVVLGLVVLSNIATSGAGSKAAGPAAVTTQAAPPSQAATTQVASASQAATTQAAAPTTQAAVPATTKAAPTLPGIGTPVTSGDLEFTVTGYACGVTVKDYKQLTPQGQFCKLDLTIKNNGKKKALIYDEMVKLKGAAGVEYSTSSETIMVEGAIFLKDINPGITMTGTGYFDVPKDVVPGVAAVRGGLFDKAVDVLVA